MRRRSWLWRVRPNPLRRRSYAVEAWVFLAVGLLALAGAVLAGTFVAQGLDHRYGQERAARHSVGAVLTKDAPAHFGATKVEVPASWKAPDGTARTGTVKAGPGSSRGAVVQVWTDDRGRLAAPPLARSVAQFQAGVFGGLSALGVCVVAGLGCVITDKVVGRRRSDRWAADWAAADARWGHRNV
ncbi:hypothetical protein SAMN05216251_101365 [Actinacidiphila alni]|uniref:Integral membrane protein n=1 Tax=Actinacidiphila alni TaxID=380248 RepID=A0A1I1XG43_9ACTN|nr:hypothetical protein [Actinacidiphila alni]SFE06335.1 hypothetical protein SAMN05216251_101365 [Actinacidiphila alni]